MHLSLIIPAYNEEKRLQNTLENIYSYFMNEGYDYEVIVVDDGSSDRTKQVAKDSALSRQGKLILLENIENKGKGFSVRRGILAAHGDYILFSDADLSTPIAEYEKLSAYLKSGYDIAIGSRSIQGADVRVRQPFYREYMGRFFNLLVQAFVFKGIIDTQCGFKLFKADKAKELARCFKINSFAFDVEMLYLAQKKGYKIKEVPVIWINSPASRVNPLVDSFGMFWELLSIKRLHGGN